MTPSDGSSTTPGPAISHSLLRVAWMADPLAMASRLTRGRFQTPPHLTMLARMAVETVLSGGRLLVQMPPRHGKSETCSVWLPLWLLNLWPERTVMLASYEADFAAGWGRRVRNVVEEHADQLLVRLAEDSGAAHRWHTPEGGGMVTAGVGGPLTGRGASLLLIDDPIKNSEEAESPTMRDRAWEWWRSTAVTRLEPGAAAIVVMTRWHEDDLAGRLMREEGSRWRVLKLPALAGPGDPLGRPEGAALWPERYDEAALAERRREVGSRVWQAEFQQSPVPEGGGILKAAWWRDRRYRRDAEGAPFVCADSYSVPLGAMLRFVVVDPAVSARQSADFTAIGCFGLAPDRRLLLLDLDRRRMEGVDVVPAVERMVARWGASQAWFEDAGQMLLLIQQARRAALPVRCYGRKLEHELRLPSGAGGNPKVPLFHAAAPMMEAVRLWLPRSATWLADLEDEMTTVPYAPHDDATEVVCVAALLADRLRRGPPLWASAGTTPDRDGWQDPRHGVPRDRPPDLRWGDVLNRPSGW